MLRFAVFDDFGPAKSWELRHARLIGKEGVNLPGEIRFADGMLECRKEIAEAVALELQYDTGDAGLLTLQTTLLPEGERPWLLDLELARHRIMVIIEKLEDWGLAVSLAADDPILVEFNQARDLFTDALVEPDAPFGHFTARQATTARQSLLHAIAASEALARRQARRQLLERLTQPGVDAAEADPVDPDAQPTADGVRLGPGVPQLGCVIHNERFAPPLQKIVAQTFDVVTSPMRWADIESEEGKYDFRATDRWIEWTVRSAQRQVMGGPLVDFAPGSVPEWLLIWEHDYDTLREFAFEHVSRVVKRYRRAIARWTIVSAPSLDGVMSLSLDQWIDLTRLTALAVRKTAPHARVVVEIRHPFGERPTGDRDGVPPMLYAEMLLHSGVQVDGFGLRLLMGDTAPGRSCRDMMQLSDVLDQYARLERAMHVTALGAPSESIAGDAPGYWRARWSGEQQAAWLGDATLIALSKPFVRSVAWQCLWDTSRPEMPGGGLITGDGRGKPALRRIADVSSALRAGRVPDSFGEDQAATTGSTS